MSAFDAAKKAAEEDSNKAYWKWAITSGRTVGALVGIVLIVMFTIWLKSPSVPKIVRSSAGAQKTFIVSMPPNGDSQRFSVRAGETPHYVSEHNAELRWQCDDGRTVRQDDPRSRWCTRDVIAYWMRDLSGSSNSATITIR